ncbi:GGDEF domain-containing protein [Butyrivibrio sp. CB08]|uniref:GGDEF domain-containing phosphodiesterase n=1 Tax=Butyrivibrio sp. CB08 TaxID=2364879 RepID=UPI000EAABDE5|nr:GGDEF domain-containing phosphodiesterase [Butyrivibrio sp. CB08]RKM61948.1 GGDEF domain-containing protein [Butyrivibrio sp. CB08]
MGGLDNIAKIESDHIDELTGFFNINGMISQIQGHDAHADENSVIIYLNVMNFKTFNQRYGFAGGNDFLKGMAKEIQDIFPDELAARTGGDQFIILGKSLTEEAILDRLKRLREAVTRHQKGLPMRIKAGIYQAMGNEAYPVVMIDRAKIACDEIIKVYDKDDNFFSDELNKKNELKQYVIDNFEDAFKKNYFKVYYQKEVRSLTGKVCGYEALARWQDPEMGLISPAIFVEVLESVRLVHRLDICIIDMVCADLRDDIDSGFAVEPISVNLSQLDFELCDIMAEIDKCREKYDIPVDLLHIEVTESAISSGSDFLGEQIKKFRDAGYEVWMDDFGSGYSSLNNLKNYDFDYLKIDMAFLRTFDSNKKSKVILAAIVNMAKELGIHTLAEGVETQEQYDFLRRIGCEKLQGYLFGKPKPVSDFVREVDCSMDVCEDLRFSKYYDKIGEVNFLGSTPLRPKTMEVVNNTPISISELKEGIPRYIYANNAYLEFLSSLGLSSMEQANDAYAESDIPEVREYAAAMERASKNESHRAEVDNITNGNICRNKIRFLAEAEGKKAFAVVSRNLTTKADTDLAESMQVAMAHVFFQYFRVDLFDENGTVENIFLNGDQVAVADKEPDSVKACKAYANMYLHPEDRDRFVEFYDMTTVKQRCDACDANYIVDYYHSAIPGDKGRMQMYMLLPFRYNGKWKYISCCRYADEIEDTWK